jgi:hypothetical protein
MQRNSTGDGYSDLTLLRTNGDRKWINTEFAKISKMPKPIHMTIHWKALES